MGRNLADAVRNLLGKRNEDDIKNLTEEERELIKELREEKRPVRLGDCAAVKLLPLFFYTFHSCDSSN